MDEEVAKLANADLFKDTHFDTSYLKCGRDVRSHGEETLVTTCRSAYITNFRSALSHRKASKSTTRFYSTTYEYSDSTEANVANSETGEQKFVEELINRATNPNGYHWPLIKLLGKKGAGKTFFLNNIVCKYMDRFNHPNTKIFWVRTSLTQVYEGWSFRQRHMHQTAYIFVKHYLVYDLRKSPEPHQYLRDDFLNWSAQQNFTSSGEDGTINIAKIKREIDLLHEYGKRVKINDESTKDESETRNFEYDPISEDLYFCVYKFLLKENWHMVYVIDGLDPYFATDKYYSRFSSWLREAIKMVHEDKFKAQYVFAMRDTTDDWAMIYHKEFGDIFRNEDTSLMNENERSSVGIEEYFIREADPYSILEKRIRYLDTQRAGQVSYATSRKYCVALIYYLSIALERPYEDVLHYLFEIFGYNTRQFLNILIECSNCLYLLLSLPSGDKQLNADQSKFDINLAKYLHEIDSQSTFKKIVLSKEKSHDHSKRYSNISDMLESQKYRIFGPLVKGMFVYQNEPVEFKLDDSVPLGVLMRIKRPIKAANHYGAIGNYYSFPHKLLANEFGDIKEEYNDSFVYFSRILLVVYLSNMVSSGQKNTAIIPLSKLVNDFNSLNIPKEITCANCRYIDFFGLCKFKFELNWDNIAFEIEAGKEVKKFVENILFKSIYFSQIMNSIPLPISFLNDEALLTSHDNFKLIYHFEKLTETEKNQRLEIMADHLKNQIVFVNFYQQWLKRMSDAYKQKGLSPEMEKTLDALYRQIGNLKNDILHSVLNQYYSASHHNEDFRAEIERAFSETLI